MAFDAFLMLDGIKGESVDGKHKDEIDVRSFSWGVSQTGTGHTGAGSGAGKADFQDLQIVKSVDKSTPLLKLACASGKHITKGKLTVRKAGENPLEYLTIDLENILVSSYSLTGVSGSSEVPDEQVTFNFAKMKTEYWTQTKQGAKGENANFSWDVSANQKY
jgi:type VI secretion system secreted protein Hcp